MKKEPKSLSVDLQAGYDKVHDFDGSYEDKICHTKFDMGGAFHPQISPIADELLFTGTFNSHQMQIYSKPLFRDQYVQLTGVRWGEDAEGSNWHPRYSPDGKWIVFVSDRDKGNVDLYLMPNGGDSNPPKRLTHRRAPEIHPSWSPDGRYICYNYVNPTTNTWEIWIHEVSTGKEARVAEGRYPEWNPEDANLIVFQKESSVGVSWYNLWTLNLSGGKNVEKLIVRSNHWGAANPGWSPDGKWIVFNSSFKGLQAREDASPLQGDDIWIIDLEGRFAPQQITSNKFEEYDPVWGRDGNIYFVVVTERMVGDVALGYQIIEMQNVWSVKPFVEFGVPEKDEGPDPIPATGRESPVVSAE